MWASRVDSSYASDETLSSGRCHLSRSLTPIDQYTRKTYRIITREKRSAVLMKVLINKQPLKQKPKTGD
ncbi:hypothetical protein BABINDRAFT_159101 [Babjeviella inositovora NRRL Y-12698]|uniref:Uncharacterized protein n=1 Tax=Babjeviella inositovora NRRL Y-12698 TaxID=984486 RepID=A0A1E3QZM4_9ASCO|nr:uncharacterized protein BABINDRAFT_159101 [Babjeviella inositovora NRRL Y-12698]ODQ82532.1 hypothetical protein BABINDRAFT_159101 [Babjeviella inositovora NRRL Y-12698]